MTRRLRLALPHNSLGRLQSRRVVQRRGLGRPRHPAVSIRAIPLVHVSAALGKSSPEIPGRRDPEQLATDVPKEQKTSMCARHCSTRGPHPSRHKPSRIRQLVMSRCVFFFFFFFLFLHSSYASSRSTADRSRCSCESAWLFLRARSRVTNTVDVHNLHYIYSTVYIQSVTPHLNAGQTPDESRPQSPLH